FGWAWLALISRSCIACCSAGMSSNVAAKSGIAVRLTAKSVAINSGNRIHHDGDFCRSSEQVYRNHIPSSQGLGSFIFQAPGDVGVLAIPDSGISRRLIPKNGGNKLPPRPFGATYRK